MSKIKEDIIKDAKKIIKRGKQTKNIFLLKKGNHEYYVGMVDKNQPNLKVIFKRGGLATIDPEKSPEKFKDYETLAEYNRIDENSWRTIQGKGRRSKSVVVSDEELISNIEHNLRDVI